MSTLNIPMLAAALRVLRTSLCRNLLTGIKCLHRSLASGGVPRLSKVELDAQKEPRRSAFSLAAWASESSFLSELQEDSGQFCQPIFRLCFSDDPFEGPRGEILLLFKYAGFFSSCNAAAIVHGKIVAYGVYHDLFTLRFLSEK